MSWQIPWIRVFCNRIPRIQLPDYVLRHRCRDTVTTIIWLVPDQRDHQGSYIYFIGFMLVPTDIIGSGQHWALILVYTISYIQ
jgi:hypothetical protein